MFKILIVLALFIIAILQLIILMKDRETYSCPYTTKTCDSECGNKINGVWTSLIGCGQDSFNLISLGTALPDYFSKEDHYVKFFSNNITGSYKKSLSDKIPHLVSIGGSNATKKGWTDMLTSISSTEQGVEDFYRACQCRGLQGIDWDLEEIGDENIQKILAINTALKKAHPEFIIMLTILLGSPGSWKDLLPHNDTYDYLTLMLYNGGMYYKENPSGGGCDWDQWAEMFLSKGAKNCDSYRTLDTYKNLASIIPQKVLLALIVDTKEFALNGAAWKKAQDLVAQYDAGGTMMWVLPGFANSLQDNLKTLKTITGIDVTELGCVPSDTCEPVKKPCDENPGCDCVSTACGNAKQGVTDEDCKPCSTGQSYWPCEKNSNFCECKTSQPPDACSKYI